MSIPTLAEFEDAAACLDGVITRTPIDESQHLSDLLGVPVHLKLENLQRTGSFKIRGATYRLSRLTAEERARGVVAASAGNHAQGVALAAQALGIPATIFMPLGVPVPKLLATRGYGAEVVLEGATVETPLRLAAEFAERTGAVLIHPFDHRDIIIGQGTLGLELFDAVPDLDTDRARASAAAASSPASPPRSRRVPPRSGAPCGSSACRPRTPRRTRRRSRRGIRSRSQTRPTIADGIAVARPGDIPFEIIRELVDEVVTVTDDDIARALLDAARAREAGRRARRRRRRRRDPRRQGARRRARRSSVLSGGNIDPLLLQRVVVARARGIRSLHDAADPAARSSRVSWRACRSCSRRPARTSSRCMHTRHGQGLQISEVILQLSVETRGEEHRAHVIEILGEAGFAPTVVPD